MQFTIQSNIQSNIEKHKQQIQFLQNQITAQQAQYLMHQQSRAGPRLGPGTTSASTWYEHQRRLQAPPDHQPEQERPQGQEHERQLSESLSSSQ